MELMLTKSNIFIFRGKIRLYNRHNPYKQNVFYFPC